VKSVAVRRSATASSTLGPLPARLQHGRVELVPETVKDAHGAPAQPWRAVDTIELLLQRGTITKEAAIAAEQFRRAFRFAALDPMRAADMARVPGGRGRSSDPPTWAREAVGAAIDALGGAEFARGIMPLAYRRSRMEHPAMVQRAGRHCATGGGWRPDRRARHSRR